MRWSGVLASILVGAVVLAGCGGRTATDSGVNSTTSGDHDEAPGSSSNGGSSGTSSGESSATTTSSSSNGTEAEPPATLPEPQDPVTFTPPLILTEGAGHEASMTLGPDGELASCSLAGTAFETNPVFLSHDNGDTWTMTSTIANGDIRTQLTGLRGDCDVAYDPAGNLYLAQLANSGVVVSVSADHGGTWVVNPVASGALASLPDRPWLTSVSAGVVHLSWVATGATTLQYTRSDNAGGTFLPPVLVVSSSAGSPLRAGSVVSSPDNLELWLPFLKGPAAGATTTMQLAHSTNGGLTWATIDVAATMGNPFLWPSLGRDAGGILHYVWHDGGGDPDGVLYSFSKDRAATWSEPFLLAEGLEGWPFVAGGSDGQAAVVVYGTLRGDEDSAGEAKWLLHWFRVTGVRGEMAVDHGTTTSAPLAAQDTYPPEYSIVRLDDAGQMFVASAIGDGDGATANWKPFFQKQTLGPAT